MYKRIGWIELDVTQVIRAVICHSDVGGAPWYPDDWTVIGSIWVVDQRIVGESDGRDMRASVVFATANVAHVKLAIRTDAPVAADGLLLFVDEKWSLNLLFETKFEFEFYQASAVDAQVVFGLGGIECTSRSIQRFSKCVRKSKTFSPAIEFTLVRAWRRKEGKQIRNTINSRLNAFRTKRPCVESCFSLLEGFLPDCQQDNLVGPVAELTIPHKTSMTYRPPRLQRRCTCIGHPRRNIKSLNCAIVVQGALILAEVLIGRWAAVLIAQRIFAGFTEALLVAGSNSRSRTYPVGSNGR